MASPLPVITVFFSLAGAHCSAVSQVVEMGTVAEASVLFFFSVLEMMLESDDGGDTSGQRSQSQGSSIKLASKMAKSTERDT